MRLLVAAVGRKDPFAEATRDYLDRASATGRPLGLTGPTLHAVEAPRATSGAVRQAREAALLSGALPDGARLVLLDEGGKDATSRDVARLVAREREAGTPSLAFLIGGADGFAEGFAEARRPRVAGTIAFGRATWPHMLVRLMLAEQLYRATTILTNHPYHRD